VRRFWSDVPTDSGSFRRPRLILAVNHAAFLVSHRLPIVLRARDAGWDVTAAAASDAVCSDMAAVECLRDHGVDFVSLPISRSGRSPGREVQAYRALLALYRRIRPSVVHHVTIKPVIYGSRAASTAGVPGVVNAVAGLGSLFLNESLAGRMQRSLVLAMYRRALAHPNVIMLFQNYDDAEAFSALRLGGAARRAVIRGSGVDLDAFQATPEPLDQPPLVVFPARLLRDKGIVEFVAAAEQLRAAGSDARFAIVGGLDPNPSAISDAELDEWRQRGVIEVWGHSTDMPAVYAQSAIVCLPSYREGFSKALIEAGASGRAIVTTDVPGCRDAVTSDSALLVPPRDATSLATAIRTLLGDADLRRRMGAAGRRLAESEFSIDAVADQTMALYEQLMLQAA
jgi:glycosyltransferase involved in cell wall biosynthesis